jgi:hypothetical protein
LIAGRSPCVSGCMSLRWELLPSKLILNIKVAFNL